MNNGSNFHILNTVVGTVALAAGYPSATEIDWSMGNGKSYSVDFSSSSYSSFVATLPDGPIGLDAETFAAEVSQFFAKFSLGQERLGGVFEKILNDNIESLYES